MGFYFTKCLLAKKLFLLFRGRLICSCMAVLLSSLPVNLSMNVYGNEGVLEPVIGTIEK